MATSGSITTNEVQGRSITLSWSLSSQSVANNTSTISWTLKGSGSTASNVYVVSGSFTAVINGTTVYSSATRINLKKDQTIASGTATITHNNDGSKSFGLSCQAAVYTGTVSVSASSTHTLPSIARASSISISGSTMGSSTTLSITRASSSFTHTISYAFGSASGTIATKASSTTVKWTPPLDLANQIPNSISGTGTITCDTYSGTTKIGTSTCKLTLAVPETIIPTISSLSVSRIDGDVPSSWGIYVQSKSKAELKINGAAGTYGSAISSYSISGGGYSGSESTLTTGYLNTSGTVTFTATVTDSRGRTSNPATVSITVNAYAVPSFSSSTSQRCNSSGTADDEGTYVLSKNIYTYSSCSSKNTVTRKTEYRKLGSTSWTNANKSFSSNTAFTFGGSISTDSTYEVRFTLTDAFTSVSITDTISTAAVVMDFKAGGKGVAIGKVSEYNDTFEVAMNTRHTKPIVNTYDGMAYHAIRYDSDGKEQAKVRFGVATDGIYRGIYDDTVGDWLIARKSLTLSLNEINGHTRIKGNLTIMDHSTQIGTVTDSNPSSSVSIPNNAWTETTAGMSLTAGSYVVSYSIQFANGTSKRRGGKVIMSTDGGTTFNTVDNGTQYVAGGDGNYTIAINGSCIVSSISDFKIRLQAYQDTGSALTIKSFMRTVRIA